MRHPSAVRASQRFAALHSARRHGAGGRWEGTWKTKARSLRMVSESTDPPLTRTCPERRPPAASPATALSSVVLPAPDAPMIAVNFPGGKYPVTCAPRASGSAHGGAPGGCSQAHLLQDRAHLSCARAAREHSATPRLARHGRHPLSRAVSAPGAGPAQGGSELDAWPARSRTLGTSILSLRKDIWTAVGGLPSSFRVIAACMTPTRCEQWMGPALRAVCPEGLDWRAPPPSTRSRGRIPVPSGLLDSTNLACPPEDSVAHTGRRYRAGAARASFQSGPARVHWMPGYSRR